MCKLKSAIILKDRVFIPDYDSHSNMLEELGIKDNSTNPDFVRAELFPKNDVFSDIDSWVFNVDQDFRPDWFVEEVEKERMIKAVKGWAKGYIHIGQNLTIREGTHYLKGSTVKAYNNSTVTACNNSTVTAYGNSTVTACNNSTVTAWNNSTVTAYDNSTVKAYGNSTVTACNSSTVTFPDYSSNKRENITLLQNSTLKDCKTKTIYQAGDWRFERV